MSSNPAITIGVNAIDSASEVLDGVDSKARTTAQSIIDGGDKIDSKWSTLKDNFKAHGKDMVLSTSELASSVVGLTGSITGLERAHYQVDKANLTLQKSQDALKKLQDSGKATAEQLAVAQEQVRLNTERSTLAQQNYHESMNEFLLQIPGQVIQFFTGATQLVSLFGVESIAAGLKSVIFGTTTTASLGTVNVVTAESTGLLGAFRMASISAFLMNPATAAILGIATLVLLLTTNFGGLRDMVFSLGDAIMQFLDDHFKPLHDAIEWFLSNIGQLFGLHGDTGISSSTSKVASGV